jgi:large repetitive protein
MLLPAASHAAASVSLAWDPSPEPGVAGYRLHYGQPPGNYSDIVDAGAVTNVMIRNLIAGATYSFYVTCYNVFGLESEPSNIVDYSVPSPTNSAPVADAQQVTTTEGAPVAIFLTGTDPEGTPLNYTLVDVPQHGSLTGYPPGNLVYAPLTDYFGPDRFSFTVSDGFLSSGPATVSITVLQANRAPVAASPSVRTDEDTAVTITLTATDPDGDVLSYTVLADPAHGTLTGTVPTLTYWPATNYAGSDSFRFKANDGRLDSATAAVAITVTAVNDPPVAMATNATTTQNLSVPITLSAADADNDPLIYTVVSAPTHGTLSGIGPNRSYLPWTNYYGSDNFTYLAKDGALDSAIAMVSITVKQTNSSPTAKKGGGKLKHNPSAAETPALAPLAITLTGTDPDGDPLTYEIVSPPQHGTLHGQGPNLVYTADPSFSGSDAFTFRVSDGCSVSDLAEFTIVDPLANPPPLRCSLLDATAGQTRVHLHVDETSGLRYELQASANLSDWNAITASEVSQPLDYTDADTVQTARFYRVLVSYEEP